MLRAKNEWPVSNVHFSGGRKLTACGSLDVVPMPMLSRDLDTVNQSSNAVTIQLPAQAQFLSFIFGTESVLDRSLT